MTTEGTTAVEAGSGMTAASSTSLGLRHGDADGPCARVLTRVEISGQPGIAFAGTAPLASLHGLRRHVGGSAPRSRARGGRLSRGSGLQPRTRRPFRRHAGRPPRLPVPSHRCPRPRTARRPRTHRVCAQCHLRAEHRALGAAGSRRRPGDLAVRPQRRAAPRPLPEPASSSRCANALRQSRWAGGPGRGRSPAGRRLRAGRQRGFERAGHAGAPRIPGAAGPRRRGGGGGRLRPVGGARHGQSGGAGRGRGGVHGAQGAAGPAGHGRAVGARRRGHGADVHRRHRRRFEPPRHALGHARPPGGGNGERTGDGGASGRVLLSAGAGDRGGAPARSGAQGAAGGRTGHRARPSRAVAPGARWGAGCDGVRREHGRRHPGRPARPRIRHSDACRASLCARSAPDPGDIPARGRALLAGVGPPRTRTWLRRSRGVGALLAPASVGVA